MRLTALLLVAVFLVLGVLVFWRPTRQSGEAAAASPASPASPAAAAGAAPRAESLDLAAPEVLSRGELSERRESALGALDPAAPPEGPAPLATARLAIDHETSNDELRKHAMDLALLAEDRILAAEYLRFREEADGSDARTSELVRSMIELAALVPDGEMRGDIWKALEGCRDPALVEPLIECLLHDGESVARGEAAETLGAFVADKRVRDALQLAADTDPSPDVRKEARGSLDG